MDNQENKSLAVRLDRYDPSGFDRGRSKWLEMCWLLIQALFIGSWLPGNGMRIGLLRLFGAKIGKDVVIKPGLKVKFPWRLQIGDHCWLGEGVWIDNLDLVIIEDHCCISQGAYLCTGSHDWSRETFDLITKPIHIGKGAWLGAFSRVAPGTVIGAGAVLALGSTGQGNMEEWTIYQGVPAKAVRKRTISR
ncbi:MAG TPA: colanic acid biosynthesis acetyltransferase WcaF [Desulfobacteraceae bacterium]|nr:colanic acid biosynthesis acetyltransferase WcaF [Desulfobacteraceae bacterium]